MSDVRVFRPVKPEVDVALFMLYGLYALRLRRSRPKTALYLAVGAGQRYESLIRNYVRTKQFQAEVDRANAVFNYADMETWPDRDQATYSVGVVNTLAWAWGLETTRPMDSIIITRKVPA